MLILTPTQVASMTGWDLWAAVQADRKSNGCAACDVRAGEDDWKVYISRSRARHEVPYIHLWREVEVPISLPDGTDTGTVQDTVHILGRATQRVSEMRPG